MEIPRGIDGPETALSSIDWPSVMKYQLLDEYGRQVTFGDIYRDKKTIIIFIRHFLCFATKEYVEDLARIPKDSLQNGKVRLAVVGCGDAKFMKQFRKDTGYQGEFYTDPSTELYKLMGCKSSSNMGDLSCSKHVKSSIISGVLKSAWRASTYPGEWQGNVDQQGALFILGPGNQYSFAHVDENTADHFPLNKLLDMVGVENVSFPKDAAVINV